MKKNIHAMKVIKIVQMASLVVLGTVFFIILLSNHVMRSSIYSDKTVFTLCAMMWGTTVLNFLFILYDFFKLRQLKIQNHELENLVYLDEKTGIPNRSGMDILFDHFMIQKDLNKAGCVVTQISNIRLINAAYGKEFGDRSIREFSRIFLNLSESYGFGGRNGGNEFVTVVENCTEEKMQAFLAELNRRIDEYNSTLDDEGKRIVLTSEYVINKDSEYRDLSKMLSDAYSLLRK